jgi:hypothetical protein
MEEEEIVKHTKRIYKTWFNKELSIWHKISEFLIEIIIIVFAVTISIWFHNRSEHHHQQEEVRIFLEGLNGDLTHDIEEMEDDRASYVNQARFYRYISMLKFNRPPKSDTIKKYQPWWFNTTSFNPNDGRFQGFKSSGKVGYIENDSLQNDIMDMYEENIPALLSSSNMYIKIKLELLDLYFKSQKRLTDSTTNFLNFWTMDQVNNISGALADTGQVLERYDNCIRLMKRIIAEIDKQNAG